MFLENCKVLSNEKISEHCYLIKVSADKSLKHAKPGQFFMLKVNNEIYMLRRPISLHDADKLNRYLEFYYEVKGGGTKEFSTLKENDTINIQGPLGNGFSYEMKGKTCVVVGGGMGIAPTKLLINELSLNNNVIFIAGGRNKDALQILKSLDLSNVETYITTDDGSFGEKGTVLTALEKVLNEKKVDIVQTCGPHKMMEAVAKLASSKNVLCEISLEEKMACGIKACVGCSIKTNDGMKKVCHDGPVFEATTIIDTSPKENVSCNCNK